MSRIFMIKINKSLISDVKIKERAMTRSDRMLGQTCMSHKIKNKYNSIV